MVSIYRKYAGGPAEVYLKTTDTKPTEEIPNGSSLIFIDDQGAGAMFFDADEKAWIDKDGATWTQ